MNQFTKVGSLSHRLLYDPTSFCNHCRPLLVMKKNAGSVYFFTYCGKATCCERLLLLIPAWISQLMHLFIRLGTLGARRACVSSKDGSGGIKVNSQFCLILQELGQHNDRPLSLRVEVEVEVCWNYSRAPEFITTPNEQ